MSLNIKSRIEIIRKTQLEILQDLNVSVVERIESILGMLSHSRQLLSSMTLVRKFSGATLANPLPPSPVLERTRYTDISLYAKPVSPGGLLFFMGDAPPQSGPADQAQCASDFVAIEMRDRKVHFALCVGSTYVNTSTNDELQTDGKLWYEIKATM